MFSIVALMPALITGIYAIQVSSKNLRIRALTTQTAQAEILAKSITSFLSMVKGDILFLSQSPLMKSYLHLRGKKSFLNSASPYQIAPSDLEPKTLQDFQYALEKNRKKLEKEFLTLSRNRRIYYQLRYLDETGQEIVRIDSDGLRNWIVDKEQLQNKSDRYYFKNTMRLLGKRVFVSPLDLNREMGKIEVPHKPVIRYAVNVYDNNNQKAGIVIMNVDANQFLEPLNDARLVTKDGYFAAHPDAKKRWGGVSDLKTGYNLSKEYPRVANQIRGRNNTISTPTVTLSHFRVSVPGSADNWVLIVQRDTDDILKSVVAFRTTFILILVFTIVIALFFALLFSTKITKPIEQLTRVADAISKGELTDNRVTILAKGEIGQLALAFERMRVTMIKSFERLRKQSGI
jgi:HAMP domain-containing protein